MRDWEISTRNQSIFFFLKVAVKLEGGDLPTVDEEKSEADETKQRTDSVSSGQPEEEQKQSEQKENVSEKGISSSFLSINW